MPESLLVTLDRWEAAGAHWRVLRLAGGVAEVELRTCMGEPVERRRSADPEVLAYLARRASSDEGMP